MVRLCQNIDDDLMKKFGEKARKDFGDTHGAKKLGLVKALEMYIKSE